MDIPIDRNDQKELPKPIEIDWTGKLRTRVGERHSDYAGTHVEGDDWAVSDNAEPYAAAAYRCLCRFQTKIVIETVEEAYAMHGTLQHYTDASQTGVTWLSPMGAKCACRIRSEIREKLRDLGYSIDRIGPTHITIEE